ncbi:(2Fe-2S)-binding protein [Eilatimonas milleporae]|uniref:Isoquinoline 1-oxidoreductase alpha subunit n=1 Tax=Eilatimonas milleporae TaxID=911205 RepID=A0A3M0CXF9_9PROT|nr:(2Fe-2S)-binding protein [Eilatimonas milleporae]RMB12196.1 isoquinoline 1-oxidoreductase alpha subunit [Eilatimonas milleporae]
MTKVTLNGRSVELDGDGDMPVLWYLRDIAGLTGTKFGCGAGLCGACTIHVDGEALRSCQTRLDDIQDGSSITTIEGLADGETLHALQQAWAEHNVPQCGYCQAGQIMQAAVLLTENPNPSDADIDEAMWGNICRCGTYQRIKAAIRSVAGTGSASTADAARA